MGLKERRSWFRRRVEDFADYFFPFWPRYEKGQSPQRYLDRMGRHCSLNTTQEAVFLAVSDLVLLGSVATKVKEQALDEGAVPQLFSYVFSDTDGIMTQAYWDNRVDLTVRIAKQVKETMQKASEAVGQFSREHPEVAFAFPEMQRELGEVIRTLSPEIPGANSVAYNTDVAAEPLRLVEEFSALVGFPPEIVEEIKQATYDFFI